jgi:hypothetical protein
LQLDLTKVVYIEFTEDLPLLLRFQRDTLRELD